MQFPIDIKSQVDSHNGQLTRAVKLHRGLSTIVGPNGSGKTHLLRGLKKGLEEIVGDGKAVRFMSAGRLGPLESFRSDYDGHRNGTPLYANANFGAKGDLERRNLNETLNGDFQTLSARADIFVMIQERLRKLFKRNMEVDWDGGQLKINFSRMDVAGEPYSSGREASGLLQLVGLLCAVYNDEIGALLIDEPEVSLHPQLQAFLLSEMERIAGIPAAGSNRKLIIIATHSTEMIQLAAAADVPSVIFCYDLRSEPVQISPTAGELSNKRIQSLVARLGQEHKLALFSKRPLLVEGPSDLIVCSALSRRLDLHLEAAGSQLLPVIGTGQMPIVVKFLRLLGKTPVVLADADAIADSLELAKEFVATDSRADDRAQKLGFESATKLLGSVYTTFCKAVDTHWSILAPLAQKHPYWINRAGAEESQSKRRASLATLFVFGDAPLPTVEMQTAWGGVKAQLVVLLNFLEDLGCFILRRGSIESYYQLSDPLTSTEKPSAAVDEVSHIDSQGPVQIRQDYADIIRCIEHAAAAKPIVEAEALRDLVLAIAAPALAHSQNGLDSISVQQLARSVLRERASLFEFSVSSGNIIVALKSKILIVPGFPLTLVPGEDVVKTVNIALGLSSQRAAMPA